jgi:DNA-binding response OmpR family regulator
MPTNSILVVEDDADVRLGYDILLRAHDYDARLVADATAAIDEVQQFPPALIILDLVLPHEDGFTVLDQLRANPSLAKVPVIVVSAKDRHINERRALDGGAQAFVQKPWDDRELLALIDQLLAPPEARPIESMRLESP